MNPKPTIASHPYSINVRVYTDEAPIGRAVTFAGALLAYVAAIRNHPQAAISIVNDDECDGDNHDGLTDDERDAMYDANAPGLRAVGVAIMPTFRGQS